MDYGEFWKKQAERQQAEIETIQPREFHLRLSDADVERLYEKAYRNGTTPAELLEGFIGDLVCGTYTHGSDEMDCAHQYFYHCGHRPKNTWLTWLLINGKYDEADELLYNREQILDDIAMFESLDIDDPELKENLRERLAEADEDLFELYNAYVFCIIDPQPYEEAVETLTDYQLELQSMKFLGRPVKLKKKEDS